jgi:hypothetical protein
MQVLSVERKQTVNKSGEVSILYKLRCFADNLMIDIEIWNQ